MKLNQQENNSQETEVEDQMVSWVNSTKYLKKSLHLSSNYSKNLNRKENFQTHSLRPASPWCQNQRYHTQKRKIQASITDEHRCKNSQQNISNQINQYIEKDYTPWSSGILSQGRKDGSVYANYTLWYTTLINWRIKIIQSSQ